jgi:hypothetical protein
MKNSATGKRVVPCGRTDRHDEANSRFSQLCERDWKEWRSWLMKIVCCDFRPYSLRVCFLQVNVKSIQKRHATIWMKDILIIFNGTQSCDTWMKADIHKVHFCMWYSSGTFSTLELSTSCTCCKRTTQWSSVPHKISPASLSEIFAFSSYNKLRVVR